MVIPDKTNASTIFFIALSSLLTILGASFAHFSTAVFTRSEIVSQKYSPFNFFESIQSARAIYFPNTSPRPEQMRYIGAFFIISISPYIP